MFLKHLRVILSAVAIAFTCILPMQQVYAADENNEEQFLALIEQTGSDYGYLDMDNRSNPEGRKQFYNDLMETMTMFSVSDNNQIDLDNVYVGEICVAGMFILEKYGLTFNEASEVFEMFKSDNPIFYFLTDTIYAFPVEDQTYIVTAADEEFSELSTRKAYNESIIEFVDSYSSYVNGISAYEDAKAIHDKLIVSMEYAYEEDGVTPINSTATTSIIGSLEKRGISMAYAKTYQMLCNYYGIETIYVRGETHSWDLIKLDNGQYYYVDTVLDDTGDEIDYSSYAYFAVGSRKFDQNHTAKTPEGEAAEFQYALPEVSEIRFCSVEFNTLYYKTCTDYGYLDMESRSNTEGRKKFYNDLVDDMIRLWSDYDLDFEPIPTEVGTFYMRNIYMIETYGITKTEAKEVYNTFREDHPLFYYVSNEFFSIGTDDMTYYFLTIFGDFAEGSVRKAYNNMIYDYIVGYSACVEGVSLYEDAKALHDQLILSIDYAYEEDGITPQDNGKVHSIIGALEGSGTCEAYSKTYQMLCNYYGIENVYVEGYTGLIGLITNTGHAWNIIRLDDGQYYNVDCTGDDLGNDIDYTYFAAGSFTFDNNHIPYTPKQEGFDFQYALPKISQSPYQTPITDGDAGTDNKEDDNDDENTISGDADGDGELTVSDIVLLQKWLLAVPNVNIPYWQAVDMYDDDKLDVFDLCLLKQKLVNG